MSARVVGQSDGNRNDLTGADSTLNPCPICGGRLAEYRGVSIECQSCSWWLLLSHEDES